MTDRSFVRGSSTVPPRPPSTGSSRRATRDEKTRVTSTDARREGAARVEFSPTRRHRRERRGERKKQKGNVRGTTRLCSPRDAAGRPPSPRGQAHRTTDLRVGLVFRGSIVKKYYRKYCLVRTRTPQAGGASRGRPRARGIVRSISGKRC